MKQKGKNLSHFDFRLSTMGRGIDKEREIFVAAGAAVITHLM